MNNKPFQLRLKVAWFKNFLGLAIDQVVLDQDYSLTLTMDLPPKILSHYPLLFTVTPTVFIYIRGVKILTEMVTKT